MFVVFHNSFYMIFTLFTLYTTFFLYGLTSKYLQEKSGTLIKYVLKKFIFELLFGCHTFMVFLRTVIDSNLLCKCLDNVA